MKSTKEIPIAERVKITLKLGESELKGLRDLYRTSNLSPMGLNMALQHAESEPLDRIGALALSDVLEISDIAAVEYESRGYDFYALKRAVFGKYFNNQAQSFIPPGRQQL